MRFLIGILMSLPLYAFAQVYTQCQVQKGRGYGTVIHSGSGSYNYSGSANFLFFDSTGAMLSSSSTKISIHLNGDDTETIGSATAPSRTQSCVVQIGEAVAHPAPPDGGITLGTEKAECRLENGMASAWFYQSISSWGFQVFLDSGISFHYYDKSDYEFSFTAISTHEMLLPLGWTVLAQDAAPKGAVACDLGYHWSFKK